jgi:CubicO group peptidase (beta-lactamase class C family)
LEESAWQHSDGGHLLALGSFALGAEQTRVAPAAQHRLGRPRHDIAAFRASCEGTELQDQQTSWFDQQMNELRRIVAPRWVAALWTSLAVTLVAYSADAQVSRDVLTTSIETAIVEEGLVGATWALVTPEGTTTGAAGLSNARAKRPMSPEHRVQVGSVAKTLVATGVLALVTHGRVDLDAPVARYLPDLPIENRWEPESPLRVRHLLDHTGGLDDARMWQVFSLRADPDAPLRDGLTHSGGTLRLRHRPGERFSYSNTGYLLLGILIEAVTGTRYERWLDVELLAPLGMTRSTFAFVTQTGPEADPTLAMGHFDPKSTSAAVPIHVRPASQLTTTAADMARFASFLMGDGVVGGRTLVDSELLRSMSVATTTEAARGGLAAGYALGLARRDRHGVVGRCHLGNIGTFRSAICVYPEQQRAFFVAFNSDPEDGRFDRVDALLVDALGVTSPALQPVRPSGVDPTKWEGLYRVRPNRFEQFAYLDELLGVTRVRWDGEALHLEPLAGSARALTPLGGQLFRAPDRREATHVLLRMSGGTPTLSDGLRTLERVSAASVWGLWVSALVGLLALAYLVIVGALRSVQALRRGRWRNEPLRWPVLCLLLLGAAPALYLMQSFLAIGDPTAANLAVAALSGFLPIALLIGAAQRVRAGVGTLRARLDLGAIAGLLQWYAVLAAWGLAPLVLWR